MRIKDNPFNVLEVTPEDSIDTINEAAENKSFMDEENEQKYTNARDLLVFPNRRLKAEVCYTPVEPKDSSHRTGLLEKIDEFGKMAHLWANNDVAEQILLLDHLLNTALSEGEIENLFNKINNARQKAHISPVENADIVSNEARNTYVEDCRSVLKSWLDEKSNNDAGIVANSVAQVAFHSNADASGEILTAFIDLYNNKIQNELTTRCNYVDSLINNAKNYTTEEQLQPLFKAVEDFNFFAKPILLYFSHIGQSEKQVQSNQIAVNLWNLGMSYHNDHSWDHLSKIVLRFVYKNFAEIPGLRDAFRTTKSFIESPDSRQTISSQHGVARTPVRQSQNKNIPGPSTRSQTTVVNESHTLRNIVIVVLVLIALWAAFGNSDDKSSSKSRNTSSTTMTAQKKSNSSDKISYSKPPTGSGRVFSMDEMHWAAREQIRLDTMKALVHSQAGIDEYNRRVNDYNDRASHFKYKSGQWQRAQNDVNAHRSEIEQEIRNEVNQNGWGEETTYNESSNIQNIPSPSIPTESPVETFRRFHSNITYKNYAGAWNCLTSDFQSQLEYGGWVDGYRTTVRSDPVGVSITSNNGSTATLSYRLKAVDYINGRNVVQYFVGNCTLINVGGKWKIDSISARKA